MRVGFTDREYGRIISEQVCTAQRGRTSPVRLSKLQILIPPENVSIPQQGRRFGFRAIFAE
jgi:hypothetical protein